MVELAREKFLLIQPVGLDISFIDKNYKICLNQINSSDIFPGNNRLKSKKHYYQRERTEKNSTK